MNPASFEKQTQFYSTFGDKLLQHTDVLNSIQNEKKFKPITVQLVPTEVCDLKCSYCSVKNRNKKGYIPFDTIKQGLYDFSFMGAKALEITGGGNPLLYPEINEIINYAYKLGFDIGIITNSVEPKKYLSEKSIGQLKWIRVSLSALDVDGDIKIDLAKIPKEKLGLSYIINSKTTEEIIKEISDISSFYDVKFVRLAPDCLGDDALDIKTKWDDVIKKYNTDNKIFLKEINDNYFAYPDACYVGLIRPYWTHSGVYICSSHVLKTQNYEENWKLCDIKNVFKFYTECNERYKNNEAPYSIDISKCYHCYYFNNNKLLHSVATEMPDRNFA